MVGLLGELTPLGRGILQRHNRAGSRHAAARFPALDIAHAGVVLHVFAVELRQLRHVRGQRRRLEPAHRALVDAAAAHDVVAQIEQRLFVEFGRPVDEHAQLGARERIAHDDLLELV
ncbi:hypothetical protein SDC9_193818 [bioreactor metagenome]|uniref:Uncharacterized protein n=1 Tax=bioreactor metagenome TaxID=1076179 RepID=A0A645I4J7_9ZZZZ